MSVMIVTSLGDIVIDLFANRCPLTCKNFLKLCKIKYYNGCLFHTVQKDFIAQTGDPTGTGNGGDSIYKFLYGDQARFFSDELHLDVKHSKMGTVAMASAGEDLNASQFYITLHDDLDYLDGKHTVFGEVAEGLETLTRINDAYVDAKNRPFKNIRIKHTYILDDPYDDPPQLAELIPDASPDGKPKEEIIDDVRLEDDWVPLDEQLAPHEVEELLREKDARSRAVVLETIGDIPDAEIKPPDNVLFVCKLNPVTEDDDLHTIFSRFGVVTSAEVIRDQKTGDSLCYAFIEFKDNEACEQAYFKMDNALIDDRRIHVDFSQSVAKLWSQYHRKVPFSQGRGCYKCGSLDHIANNCTGENSSKQSLKYVLKDDNKQRGGDQGRSYEMVFGDEDDKVTRNSERRGHKQKEDHHQERRDRYYSEKRDGRRNENERERREGSSYRDHTRRNGSSIGKDRDATHRHSDDRERSYGDDYKHKPRRNEDSEKNPRSSREKEAIDDDRTRKNRGRDDLRDDHRDRRRTTDDAKYGHEERGGDRYSDRSYRDDDPRDRSRRRLT